MGTVRSRSPYVVTSEFAPLSHLGQLLYFVSVNARRPTTSTLGYVAAAVPHSLTYAGGRHTESVGVWYVRNARPPAR